MMFDTVLIANRGAIATRIIRTLRQMGLRSVAVYSQADEASAHVALADEAVCIGPARASESYLNIPAIIAAAKATGAGAIHPGYGFLAENVEFADACAAEGIVFIGPTADNIRTFGLKHSARELAKAHGVPLAPGSDLLTSEDEAVEAAAAIGYPIMLKATAGGGGIGMRVCETKPTCAKALPPWRAWARAISAMPACSWNATCAAPAMSKCRSSAMARAASWRWANATARSSAATRKWWKKRPRRTCPKACAPISMPRPSAWAKRRAIARARSNSLRFRSQGILFPGNEHPAPGRARRDRRSHGRRPGRMDGARRGGRFRVPRYRADHAQRPLGAGAALCRRSRARLSPHFGHADRRDFSRDIRAETWVMAGSEISAWYDPMLAKLIVHGPTRDAAVAAMQQALAATRVDGIETNLRWLRQVVASEAFTSGEVSTRVLDTIQFVPAQPARDQPGARPPRCRTGRAASTCGPWACRLRGRWTTSRSASATACWAMPKARPGWK
jgi:urea carboxylase